MGAMIAFVRKEVHEVQPTKDNNLVTSLTHILDCFLEPYRETETKKITKEDLDLLNKSIESIFMFAMVWSFGCTGDQDSRKKFNNVMRESTGVFPFEHTVYDYYFDAETKEFINWTEQFKDFEIDNKLQYHEIMIPNVDSTRNSHLTRMLQQ